MGPLDLDFRPTRPAAPLGWAILVLGLGVLATLPVLHRQWLAEAESLEAAAREMEARRPRPAASPGDRAAEEGLAAARKALEKARLPWNSLFAALEAADSQDVAILAILPDSPRSQVRIEAEARNLAAMLAYQRRLEQAGGLRQVTLVDHEAAADSGGAVRFHLAAAWGEDHGHP
jgi:hypothetical protein